MNEQNIFEEFDPFSDESRCDCMAELKDAAFEYLRDNPGTEFPEWQRDLISDYPAEVVDALGTDPEEVYAALADLWEDDYEDSATEVEQKFSEWAECFATERSVDLYYLLVDAKREIRRFKGL